MDNENKGFPNGWGDNSDDDYGFVDDTDEDDEDSAWGNSSSPFKKNEPVISPETNNKTNAQSESVTPNTNNEANDDSVHDYHVQNVEQPESISPPAPNLNVPTNPGYVIQKQKTNPVLFIVIIVLVLVIGVLGCMFFMMSKDKKFDTSGEKSAVSDVFEITEVQTESEIQNTTATTSVELNTKKDESTTKDRTDIDQNKIKEAYIRKLTEFAKSEDFNAFDYASKYALYDIDNDGIEELIIQYLSVVGNAENLYYYKNGEYEIIAQCGESSFSICPEEHCVQWYGYGGYELRSILSIEKQGNSLDELHIESYPNTVYIHNNVGISKSEYEEIIAKYDAMNWINPTFYTFNTILSDDLVYAKPETTESAKSDVPTENYAFYGIVATESDSLNLRDKPSTDSNVITQLPKGTKASVYYVEGYSDWYKVYTDNGYEGYVAAQYMKEYNEDNSLQEVYRSTLDEFMLSESFKNEDERFELYDVNSDGIPELFISSGEFHYSDLYIYTFDNGKIIELDNIIGAGGSAYVVSSKNYVYFRGGNQGTSWTLVYELNGTELTQIATLEDTTMAVSADYYGYKYNDKTISEEQYNSYMDQYTSGSISGIGRKHSFEDLRSGHLADMG